MNEQLVRLIYLIAIVIFILGIKLMTKIRSARRGNLLSSFGMLLAVIATLIQMNLDGQGIEYSYIITGAILGTLIGIVLALWVKMTAMPEMVALFNGVGGLASTLVAISYYWEWGHSGRPPLILDDVITVALSIIIGNVTFVGSVMAVAKLQGWVSGRPILFPGSHLLNLFLFLGAIGCSVLFVQNHGQFQDAFYWVIGITAISFLLGILVVTPIGGADMPVVISLLNSYSGLAAAMTGFVLKNQLLIIVGSLVGASGIILSQIMCKAMNRSLANVLFGGFGSADSGGTTKESSGYTKVKDCSVEEAAIILGDATSVVMVPGYGLAVSQAQHTVRELANILQKRGAKISYAIHPVAGRMPGHMNILLAEANIPYEQLIEMDTINPEFKNTDVVIILGANDVVNPAAIKDKTSPIYGMPILNVFEARTVFVIKRSLGSGFSGIINDLFNYDNTLMIFGDAKKVLTDMITEMKQL
ncbi:MAG: NAD(P)(+) transhydrogenase (Re/Si-specific) subunit beta [Planctomycetota bacterium]